MSITVSEVKNRVKYWMLRTFDQKAIHNFDDSEFIAILNQVARDFNTEASLWVERYYQQTVSGETNYEMQGKIIKVLFFKYEADDYDDQYYSFVEDVIVLKVSPVDTYQMEIHYTRDVENVADDTDEIDIPEHVIHDFIDLVKKRLKAEFGLEEEIVYHEYLKRLAITAYDKLHRYPLGDGVLRDWFLPNLGDFSYVITKNYLSQDSVYADVTGDYHFIA